MIRRFLKAKHWQIFMLIFVIPFIAQIFMVGNLITTYRTSGLNPPEKIFSPILGFVPLIMGLSVFTLFGWFYSVAIGLQRKIPEEYKMNINRFKIFFYIPVFYFGMIILFMLNLFLEMEVLNPQLFPEILPFMIPIHLSSIFCVFYVWYFVSKTIKTVELQREVTFSDYAGEFFMLWFYFIGVWILQPKINKMADLELKEQPFSSRPT